MTDESANLSSTLNNRETFAFELTIGDGDFCRPGICVQHRRPSAASARPSAVRSTESAAREAPSTTYSIVREDLEADNFLCCRTLDGRLRWVTGKAVERFGLVAAFNDHGIEVRDVPSED